VATYITNADLLVAVANRLGVRAADLIATNPQWEEIVATANAEAYQEIRSVLVGRGYTVEQVDAWDRRAEFNRKVAVCHALVEGALLRQMDGEALDRVCKCREELADVVLLVDGEAPELELDKSNITAGDLANPGDVFTADAFDENL
jgi:hypothetical protein